MQPSLDNLGMVGYTDGQKDIKASRNCNCIGKCSSEEADHIDHTAHHIAIKLDTCSFGSKGVSVISHAQQGPAQGCPIFLVMHATSSLNCLYISLRR